MDCIRLNATMTDQTLLAALQTLVQRGQSAVLCTVVRTRGAVPRRAGAKMLVYADGNILGTIGGGRMENLAISAALKVLGTGEARFEHYSLVNPQDGDPGVCGGTLEVFMDPIKPDPTLLVVGGGHIGVALVHLGQWLGFHVVLSDDRPEFCTPEAAPGADQYIPGDSKLLLTQFTFHPETYVVLVTRGVLQDVTLLPGILTRPNAYVGVIGSRKRWQTTVDQLTALGISEDQLGSIHSPVGLELNAETPTEIALSIMSEIVLLRRGGSGLPMRVSDG